MKTQLKLKAKKVRRSLTQLKNICIFRSPQSACNNSNNEGSVNVVKVDVASDSTYLLQNNGNDFQCAEAEISTSLQEETAGSSHRAEPQEQDKVIPEAADSETAGQIKESLSPLPKDEEGKTGNFSSNNQGFYEERVKDVEAMEGEKSAEVGSEDQVRFVYTKKNDTEASGTAKLIKELQEVDSNEPLSEMEQGKVLAKCKVTCRTEMGDYHWQRHPHIQDRPKEDSVFSRSLRVHQARADLSSLRSGSWKQPFYLVKT